MNKRGKSGDYHLNLNLDSFLFTWKDTSHGRPNMYHQKSNGREKRAYTKTGTHTCSETERSAFDLFFRVVGSARKKQLVEILS